MVKLSLPTWDRDKSQYEAGTSFTPSFAGRLRPSVSSKSSVLRRFKSADSTAPEQPESHPLMTLRLSSPSFLDSVVHDGSSDNPLYVIDTDDNVTKVRRSDPKGFINVSRVRWPAGIQKLSSRKIKDLAGVEVAFGKGTWKPANEFLGTSYGSFSRFVFPRSYYSFHRQLNFVCQLSQILHPPPPAQLEMETIRPSLCRTSLTIKHIHPLLLICPLFVVYNRDS